MKRILSKSYGQDTIKSYNKRQEPLGRAEALARHTKRIQAKIESQNQNLGEQK